MLRMKQPRVANETIDDKAIALALFENEETKSLEEEVKDDEAIAKMAQEEVLTRDSSARGSHICRIQNSNFKYRFKFQRHSHFHIKNPFRLSMT